MQFLRKESDRLYEVLPKACYGYAQPYCGNEAKKRSELEGVRSRFIINEWLLFLKVSVTSFIPGCMLIF